jgi:hypothetical protein
MTQTDLLARLDDGIRTEESAITIYLGHLAALTDRTRLPPRETARIRTAINHLVQANRDHKQLLQNLRAKIAKEPPRDY